MQEFLWEIWTGKKNTHHRIQMDLNEVPRAVFQRIIQQLNGTEKAISLHRRDPNTGQEAEVQWKFAWRSQGQELPLKNHVPFAQQGVAADALLVVREIELRAHTIYIDGFEGLGDEEIAVAKSKTPLIVGLVLFLLAAGGSGFYFLHWVPKQRALAPYLVEILTQPEGAEVEILLDISQTAKAKGPTSPVAKAPAKAPAKAATGVVSEINLDRLKLSTPARNVKIPKKAQIIFISIAKKGFKTWTAGYPIDVWNKDRAGLKKLLAIEPKELTAKNYFPTNLGKMEKPKFKAVAPPSPTKLSVQYPRRWRRFRLGLDPLHGGVDTQGASGISGKTAGDLNLAVATTTFTYLNKEKRRFQVFRTRVKDQLTPPLVRKSILRKRRVSAIVQFDFLSGINELPQANQMLKKDQKMIAYNDSVGGFLIYWSSKNKASGNTQKLAACLGQSMKQAGFQPRGPRKGESADVATLGIRTTETDDPILNGATPAVRLIPGYISHRGEDAVLNKPETHEAIATAIEAAVVCFAK